MGYIRGGEEAALFITPLVKGGVYVRTLRPAATSLVKGGNTPIRFQAPLFGKRGITPL